MTLQPAEPSDSRLICEFCGFEITSDTQDCPALDEGRCRP